jgi:hypothetical protein
MFAFFIRLVESVERQENTGAAAVSQKTLGEEERAHLVRP